MCISVGDMAQKMFGTVRNGIIESNRSYRTYRTQTPIIDRIESNYFWAILPTLVSSQV